MCTALKPPVCVAMIRAWGRLMEGALNVEVKRCGSVIPVSGEHLGMIGIGPLTWAFQTLLLKRLRASRAMQ